MSKAEAFLEDAEYDISRGKWFLAAFHLEQTLPALFEVLHI